MKKKKKLEKTYALTNANNNALTSENNDALTIKNTDELIKKFTILYYDIIKKNLVFENISLFELKKLQKTDTDIVCAINFNTKEIKIDDLTDECQYFLSDLIIRNVELNGDHFLHLKLGEYLLYFNKEPLSENEQIKVNLPYGYNISVPSIKINSKKETDYKSCISISSLVTKDTFSLKTITEDSKDVMFDFFIHVKKIIKTFLPSGKNVYFFFNNDNDFDFDVFKHYYNKLNVHKNFNENFSSFKEEYDLLKVEQFFTVRIPMKLFNDILEKVVQKISKINPKFKKLNYQFTIYNLYLAFNYFLNFEELIDYFIENSQKKIFFSVLNNVKKLLQPINNLNKLFKLNAGLSLLNNPTEINKKLLKPEHEILDNSDIQKIISLIKGESLFLKARDCIALLLMYIFKIRINELKQIKIKHLKTLKEGKGVTILYTDNENPSMIKLELSETKLKWFKDYNNEFDEVLFKLNDEDFFINLSRDHLNKRLNKYFKEYVKQNNKNVSLKNIWQGS